MKNLLVVLFVLVVFSGFAQVRVENPKRTAERSVEWRVNGRIDQGVNKGLDKVEEGIGNIFKKKNKKDKKQSEDSANQESNENAPAEQNSQTQENQTKSSTKSNASAGGNAKSEGSKSLKVYSKFDFVPGEKVIALDDFSTTSVGDFPLGWNTNSSAEIVTLDGSPTKWFSMTKDGYFQPTYVKDLPDNFTLEFDVFTRYRTNNILNYEFMLYNSDNPRRDISESYPTQKAAFKFNWSGCAGTATYLAYEDGEEVGRNDELNVAQLGCPGEDFNTPAQVHFSIWRQKSRLRVYVNEVKVLDIPQAMSAKHKYNVFKLGAGKMNYSNSTENKDEFMVSNVRYAVGAPDTRSKLITEGKFSTTGILFDVNSDKIKPESYGVLKELGSVLKENAAVKVRIIGHTDSDGDAAKNLDLSKRRATSVKNALATEFGIDAARMETDGKGQAQPAGPNTTPEGKANNRRVEFIKL